VSRIFIKRRSLRKLDDMHVKIGDMFLRLGSQPTKWTVDKLIEYPDIPPHAQLRREGYWPATMTIALSVLKNRREFQPVPMAP